MSWLKYGSASLIGFVTASLFFAASVSLVVWLTRIPPGGCGGPPCEGVRTQIGSDLIVVAGFVGMLIGSVVAAVIGVAFYRKNQQGLAASKR